MSGDLYSEGFGDVDVLPGDPTPYQPDSGPVTLQMAQYWKAVDPNRKCETCANFLPGDNSCNSFEKIKAIEPASDLPAKVHPEATCVLWESPAESIKSI